MLVLNRQRGRRVSTQALLRFMRKLARELPASESADLAICLVSDRSMRDYNRRFRGIDRPTDVLAFSGDGVVDEDGRVHLGDILISVCSAARQARERRHSLERELKILALHGYLHLLGYDHERDRGEMIRLQRKMERLLLPIKKREAAG